MRDLQDLESETVVNSGLRGALLRGAAMDTSDFEAEEKKAVLDAAWSDLESCFGIGKNRNADHERQVSHATATALAKYGIAERTARQVFPLKQSKSHKCTSHCTQHTFTLNLVQIRAV